VEESRARILGFAIVPSICLWLLATGFTLPLAWFRRRAGPTPGIGWPLCASLSLFAMPRLFVAAVERHIYGDVNLYTVGIFALSLVFGFASMASAAQAITWLPLPGDITTKLHRLLLAAAACCTTAYLAAYGIIGLRLWSY
jgi:hypothetical protein